MLDPFTTWVWENIIEISGALLGILYIGFSIRQHIFTWPTGLLTSLLYTIIFFRSGFYADMGLQVYYVVISIYGWYYWLRGGKKNNDEDKHAPILRLSKRVLIASLILTAFIYLFIVVILINFTDSTVPYMDSLTTALSITATWMLAKKYIEHWLIWIFVDLVSAGLYIYKNLWPTVILFVVYTVMAYVGYKEWEKELSKQVAH
ncbi:MAG TPA: nicotinamide riboside transporter PnuC [Mariniphaga sp.]|nr:nicotinamide riboside transporter PnuC [Mariniphaga sp.]